MKKLILTTAALVMLGSAPAMAMSCCGGAKGKAPMCGKGAMAMGHDGMKAKKGGCCCEGMAGGMSRKRA
jgi:hypothetical protein